jgi:hypothetical protein
MPTSFAPSPIARVHYSGTIDIEMIFDSIENEQKNIFLRGLISVVL